MDKKDYPKLEDYLRKKDEQTEREKYLSGFKLYQFLLEFPDALTYFNDPDRKHAFADFEDAENSPEEEFSLKCLYNEFTFLRESDITKVFKMKKRNIIKTYNKLVTIPRAFKIPRETVILPEISINNKLLLQEIAFIQHEKDIRDKKKEKELDYYRAKELGLLENCSCCFTDDIIPEDFFICRGGCKFCRECVRKGAETAYSEGKTEFTCFANCGSDFSLATLQMVLNPKMFTNLCHRIQMQEINKADIDGIKHCPCSDFAMIPGPNDQIFQCGKCNKESCLKCSHIAHVPLRCEEIEYDEDVKIRTHIENSMTQALIRKCYRCGTNIVKDSGCNNITCSICGAKMCYVCRASINDYSHFQNAGCPLFTDDRELHFRNVMKGATTAKAELGVDINPELLKFDPTRNFNN